MDSVGKVIASVAAFMALAAAFGTAYMTNDHNTELMLAGWAGGMATTVVGYYFGSSSGSAKKDDIIAAAGVQPPPAATAPEPPTSTLILPMGKAKP
jgi:hypothetical protein